MEDEQQQAFSNHLAEAIFKMPDIGLVFSRPDTSLFYVNDAICNFFGYTANELYQIKWPDITHQDDVNKDLREFSKIRNKEIDSYTIEKRYIRKDGGIFWAEISVKCIWKTQDTIDYFAAAVKDISLRKMTELRLKNQLNLADNLNEQLKRQKQKFEEYTHILSHDLRSPATSLSSLLEIFEQTDSREEKAEIWQNIKKVNANMLSTIEEINSSLSSNTDTGKSKEYTNPNDVFEWVKLNLSHQLEMSNAKLHCQCESGIQLPGNQSIHQSIFQNLISNAIKYKQAGKSPEISINISQEDDQVIMKVSDNGKGIDLDEYGDQLFRKYQTFHGGADAYGIGLYLVKMQVESLEGDIGVDSEVDLGTTFTITLPIDQ